MFTVRSSHGRALYSPLLFINQRSLFSTTWHRSAAASATPKASRYLDRTILQSDGPIAEQLAATGVWRSHGIKRRSGSSTTASPTFPIETTETTETTKATKATKKRSSKAIPAPRGDKSRVNIVGDKLCDDILSYVGPSLERHRGCDILDIYPGAGLWSSKLHQFLQPRSHVLLEPDAELYRPFLQPLLDQPGTSLVPKSGVIWRELNSVLTPEFLPHQVIPGDVDARNDTLLVTANLAFYPKKRFLNFESIASLILHQFVDTIRTSSLFQRYGLVRMLIWTRSDDTLSFLPRTIQRRKRQALENDLLCEWIREVCGDETASGSWFAREDAINHASLATTIKKMRAAKLELPAGREPKDFLETLAAVKARKRILEPGKHAPTFKRPYQDVLASLYTADTEQGGLDKDSDDFKTMNIYRWRTTSDIKTASRLLQHSQHLDKIKALHKSKKTSAKRKAAAELEWETEMREVSKVILDQFITYKDNLHAFRQTPPLLEWDRRDYEPMTVQAQEFFPNVHCSLLDIQPRAPHPLMRQMGPNSNRAADMFDLILGSLTQQPTQPLGPNLDSLWPGAADFILPRWTSTQDLSRGGFLPNLSYAEPSPRLLSARQLEQLLELWMEWPFRPEFNELVGRTQDDLDDRFDDSQHTEI